MSSIYVYQLTSARTSLSRFPAAVSLLLTVPNDDSGILTVIPLVLFGSEAERFTSSLLLSFAGGDTASLVDRVIVMPLGLLCSMASQPPWRCRCGRLQLKVSKEEHLVCQPISHQHGLVEVMSPLRFAILFCTGCVTLNSEYSSRRDLQGRAIQSNSQFLRIWKYAKFHDNSIWHLCSFATLVSTSSQLDEKVADPHYRHGPRQPLSSTLARRGPCPASSSISSSIRSPSTWT